MDSGGTVGEEWEEEGSRPVVPYGATRATRRTGRPSSPSRFTLGDHSLSSPLRSPTPHRSGQDRGEGRVATPDTVTQPMWSETVLETEGDGSLRTLVPVEGVGVGDGRRVTEQGPHWERTETRTWKVSK